MGLSICSLSSGSKGNCIFVGTDSTKILVDNGVSADYAERELERIGVGASEIDAILITHRHGDHISGVRAFCKRFGTTVYVHHREASCIAGGGRGKVSFRNVVDFFDGDFFVGDITVSPFAVSHDVFCLGYSFYHRGGKISVATDLGKASESVLAALKDSDIVMLESNHDENLLRNNAKYSEWLKRRIASANGHLSNASCGDAVVRLASGGTRQIILAHLSEENNYPELAFSEVSARLAAAGITEGKDVRVSTALQFAPTPVFRVG